MRVIPYRITAAEFDKRLRAAHSLACELRTKDLPPDLTSLLTDFDRRKAIDRS